MCKALVVAGFDTNRNPQRRFGTSLWTEHVQDCLQLIIIIYFDTLVFECG